jgi:hypothetical protein
MLVVLSVPDTQQPLLQARCLPTDLDGVQTLR